MLGITVLADYILYEGADAVLDTLVSRAGVTAVACNPTVTVAAQEGHGSFQPPTDGGTSPRLFDRPLWGKRSLWVRAEPSYHPNPRLYEDSKYRPKRGGELTDRYGHAIRQFIDACHKRGVEVYFQLPAAAPPGFTDEDAPRLPTGEIAQKRFARTASVASPAVAAYNRAYVRDLLAVYPDIDGIRPDWPEYPCYTLGEVFGDFSDHAEAAARDRISLGAAAFAEAKRSAAALWRRIHGELTDADVHWLRDSLGLRAPRAVGSRGNSPATAASDATDGITEWLRLKAEISLRHLADWREAIDEAGGGAVKLSANAFAPPFSGLTGFDFGGASAVCHAVNPKLYTMHWLAIAWLWAKELLASNPSLAEAACVTAIAEDLGLAETGRGLSLADVHYPEPDEPHAVGDEVQIAAVEAAAERVRAAGHRTAGAGRTAAVTPIVHGYGPADDFRRRFACAVRTSADGVWVNRYGYLSDEKLEAIGEIWRMRSRD